MATRIRKLRTSREKPFDFYGPNLAWVALRNLAHGLPMFPRPFWHPMQARHRRAAIAWLVEEGLVERGENKRGPTLTDEGASYVARRQRPTAWTDAELALVRRRAALGMSQADVARRLGRTSSAVRYVTYTLKLQAQAQPAE